MQFFDHPIGFSTGAIACSDWRSGLRRIQEEQLPAVELSALRFRELEPMVKVLTELDLRMFDYVSVHLPSAYHQNDEQFVVDLADEIASHELPMVLHPDTIANWDLWSHFGALLCIENMDKRKKAGRNLDELAEAFDKLPEATLCFDFGHARQVDPTMSEGARILLAFADRLQQIHFSDVDSSNHHCQLNRPALTAFSKLRFLTNGTTPVILETPVFAGGLKEQLRLTQDFFSQSLGPISIRPIQLDESLLAHHG